MATRKKRRKSSKRRKATKRRVKRRTVGRRGNGRRTKKRKATKRRVKRRTVGRRGNGRRTKKRKATPKQMAALLKAWAARGITPAKKMLSSGNWGSSKVTTATKKANGKKITRMKSDGVISDSVAEKMQAANRRGSMPMIRYIKTGDQAGVDFAGEFIGPRQEPRFIGPIHQPGKEKKPKHYKTHVSEFYD